MWNDFTVEWLDLLRRQFELISDNRNIILNACFYAAMKMKKGRKIRIIMNYIKKDYKVLNEIKKMAITL